MPQPLSECPRTTENELRSPHQEAYGSLVCVIAVPLSVASHLLFFFCFCFPLSKPDKTWRNFTDTGAPSLRRSHSRQVRRTTSTKQLIGGHSLTYGFASWCTGMGRYLVAMRYSRFYASIIIHPSRLADPDDSGVNQCSDHWLSTKNI